MKVLLVVSALCILYAYLLHKPSHHTMPLPNIVVVGGSYVGVMAAKQLAQAFHSQYRVLLIEKNSHFQHLFAFPRFAVATGIDKHKAFIPYTPGTFADCPPDSGRVVRARVQSITKQDLQLDRKVDLDGQKTDAIPYTYLVCLCTSCILHIPLNNAPLLRSLRLGQSSHRQARYQI